MRRAAKLDRSQSSHSLKKRCFKKESHIKSHYVAFRCTWNPLASHLVSLLSIKLNLLYLILYTFVFHLPGRVGRTAGLVPRSSESRSSLFIGRLQEQVSLYYPSTLLPISALSSNFRTRVSRLFSHRPSNSPFIGAQSFIPSMQFNDLASTSEETSQVGHHRVRSFLFLD